jgi:hypothetical protein
MRAELHKNQRMVAFEWGESQMIPSGQVRVSEFNYDLVPYRRSTREFPVGTTRRYWDNLIRNGYIRRPSSMPFVPRTDPDISQIQAYLPSTM